MKSVPLLMKLLFIPNRVILFYFFCSIIFLNCRQKKRGDNFVIESEVDSADEFVGVIRKIPFNDKDSLKIFTIKDTIFFETELGSYGYNCGEELVSDISLDKLPSIVFDSHLIDSTKGQSVFLLKDTILFVSFVNSLYQPRLFCFKKKNNIFQPYLVYYRNNILRGVSSWGGIYVVDTSKSLLITIGRDLTKFEKTSQWNFIESFFRLGEENILYVNSVDLDSNKYKIILEYW